MYRKIILTVGAFVVLQASPTLIAQNPAPAAGAPGQAPGQGGAPRGGRGGPALPANQPAPRDDARHKGFLEIAERGNIELLFVGDSITDWFSNPRGQAQAPAAGLEV